MIEKSASILIVDDEVDATQNLADIFCDLGYRVDVANNGRAALEKLGRTRYDVALLDLMMPGMDGAALYREIKVQRPETVAVLTTAYPGHPRAEEGMRAGIWRVVPKPVDLSRLLSTVQEAMQLPVVLVVDDDADLCANLWDLLWERGFRVGIAHDVHTARELLKQNGFNVVLIDMKLPDGEGTDLLQVVTDTDPRARTVIITGHRAENASTIDGLSRRIDAVCYKPFDVGQLLATVEKLSKSNV